MQRPDFDIDYPFIDDLMEGKSNEEIEEAKENFRAFLRLAWEIFCEDLDEEVKEDKMDK